MPKSKKLQKQIENKLEKLTQLFKKIDEARAIDSNDPETWDSDTLYDLVANLKEALKLLENQKSIDDWGESIILEEGLCSLVDEYHEEKEDH